MYDVLPINSFKIKTFICEHIGVEILTKLASI